MSYSLRNEIIRKAMHVPFVIVAVVAYIFPSHNRTIEAILAIMGVAYYCVEHLRIRGRSIPILSNLESLALRENELNQFVYAPLTLLLGIMLVMELYISPVAIASIIAVTIGDTFASICGMVCPRSHRIPWNKKKTIIGSVANALSVMAVCAVFFASHSDMWIIAAVAGIGSSIVESLDLDYVDNLIIPLFVGAMLYLTVF